ncbi:MAG: ABC transporter substrate-binding protein [bacterium]
MKRTSRLILAGALALAVGVAPLGATGTQEQDRGETQEAPEAAGSAESAGAAESQGSAGSPASTAAAPATVSELKEEGARIPEVGNYAGGFQAYRAGELTLIEVTRPWQNASPRDAMRYLLYPRGLDAPEVDGVDLAVGVPIDSIVTMSTTFLPHLEALGVMESLVAVDSAAYAYNEDVHSMTDDGETAEVGSGPDVDVERLIALDPDLIMVNSYRGDWDVQPTLEEAGLPVVVNGDWVENRPLGRAEWLLFTALFFDDLETALGVFERIEAEYRRLAALPEDTAERPTVLVNAPYQGDWSVPGGDSYAARFIRDAGGAYVWEENESTGSLFFDVESVYAEAGDADIWINPGVWTSLDQGAAEDERFTEFTAFAKGEVYNNNRRMGPGGGNDYFESGALHPERILADLIRIFHPELLPDRELFYYRKLQ